MRHIKNRLVDMVQYWEKRGLHNVNRSANNNYQDCCWTLFDSTFVTGYNKWLIFLRKRLYSHSTAQKKFCFCCEIIIVCSEKPPMRYKKALRVSFPENTYIFRPILRSQCWFYFAYRSNFVNTLRYIMQIYNVYRVYINGYTLSTKNQLKED